MNRCLIIGISGLSTCLICIFSINRASACGGCGDCGGVELNLLDGRVRFVGPGQRTLLRAYAEDLDTVECMELCGETKEVTGFDWSFGYGALQHGPVDDPCPCDGGGTSGVEVWSNTPGVYYVDVGAGDNDGHYSMSYFIIWVVDLTLNIIPTSIGIGEVAETTLSWSPSNPPGCFELSTASNSGGERISVWQNQDKTGELLGLGPDRYMNAVSAFPHTVWVEGVYAGYGAYLWFEYCPACTTVYPTNDWGVDSIRVVQVETIDGPGAICPGQTGSAQLTAHPWPSEGPWPLTEPHWEIVSQPQGANATLSPTLGSATTTVSGFTKLGDYVIKAKCGRNDPGVQITLGVNIENETPLSAYFPTWGETPFSCGGVCDGADSYETDDCGDKIHVDCAQADGTGGIGECAWRIFYDDGSGKVLVSSCDLHHSPENEVSRSLVTIQGTNWKHFKRIKHVNTATQKGAGCPGYYCVKWLTKDVITGAFSEIWRRRADDIPQDPNDGEECPGH